MVDNKPTKKVAGRDEIKGKLFGLGHLVGSQCEALALVGVGGIDGGEGDPGGLTGESASPHVDLAGCKAALKLNLKASDGRGRLKFAPNELPDPLASATDPNSREGEEEGVPGLTASRFRRSCR